MKSSITVLSKAMSLAAFPVFFCLLSGGLLSAAIRVSLTPGQSSVLVGGTAHWTASASDPSNPSATFTYQFSFREAGISNFSIVKDFYPSRTFEFTPNSHDGMYDVMVVARSSTGETASVTDSFSVRSRIVGSTPVVSPTANALVLFYSAPPCKVSAQMRVQFRRVGDTKLLSSRFKPCNGVSSMNFYVAGLYPSTSYVIRHDLQEGGTDVIGPELHYATGSLPSDADIPNHYVLKGAQEPTRSEYPYLLHAAIPSGFATDLSGQVVWYLPALHSGDTGHLYRIFPGGYTTGTMDEPATNCPGTTRHCGDHRFFREFDLAGNIARETNWSALNIQLNSWRKHKGKTPVNLTYFSHDASRLPNGNIVTIVTDEVVADQGQGPVDVLGDVIVVYDSDFHLKWAWNAFDRLDVKRKALNNETCTSSAGGCPILYNRQANGQLYSIANDWTHANSVTYDPKDGNLLISLRHQSWVVKVAYQDGNGDGHIIWRLGPKGDFSLGSGTTSSEWFNYQHDAGFQANGLLTLFDNNNASQGGDSRGQAWRLDEKNRVANLVFNADLGVSSVALGSAEILSNGNLTFEAGFINRNSGEALEFTPSGSLVFEDHTDSAVYRSFRLPTMYGLP